MKYLLIILLQIAAVTFGMTIGAIKCLDIMSKDDDDEETKEK